MKNRQEHGSSHGNSISDTDLVNEIYSAENEINTNCSLQVLGSHRSAIEMAARLLMIYGDSVSHESIN